MLDELDRGLVHALRIDARAPFSRVAEVLGVSTQTVARRYRRLRTEFHLRIVGLADAESLDQAQWIVRIGATAQAAQDVARSLAKRQDTSWVRLAAGGTEISAVIRTRSAEVASDSLLLRDVPRTAGVTSVSAHYLLHLYRGGPTPWTGHSSALTPAQQSRLRRAAPVDRDGPAAGARQPLTEVDRRLLGALQRDGRAGQAELAEASGASPATAARRVEALCRSGAVFFDVEIDDIAFGVTTQVMLWAFVAPAHLDRVARDMCQHDELAFVAATTGRTNLVAQVLCASPGELHRYLTRRLDPLDRITSLETTPVLRTLKASSPAWDPSGSSGWRTPRPRR